MSPQRGEREGGTPSQTTGGDGGAAAQAPVGGDQRGAEQTAEQAALAALLAYAEAMRAGDVEGQLAFFAEEWQSGAGRTKAEVRASLEKAAERASNQHKRLGLADAKVVVDGDAAAIDPVTMRSPTGGGILRFELKRGVDGRWRCVSLGGSRAGDAATEQARNVRERALADPARPGYHFVAPEGVAMPFDPNGALYWQGRYHLFYIFQDTRLGRRADHYGHVSSTDLFHWRHHPTGLVDGMYSGNCFLNRDGVPTLCYHQAGRGNAFAVAEDQDLNEWRKLPSNPITPATRPGDAHHGKYRSWDPFGWLEGDSYYAIFGGERPAVAKAPELAGEWRYVGDLFAHGVEGISLTEDVSCPDLFRLGGKDVLLCISHRLGCRYYVGEWRGEQFHPERHERMSYADHSFFAPESLVDDKGRRIMWAWILDEPHFGTRSDHGWSGTLSLPRVLTLGDDGRLRMDVPVEIEALRREAAPRQGPCILQPDGELAVDGVAGDSLELLVEMESTEASAYGAKVRVSPDGREETSVFYDAKERLLKVDTRRSGPDDTPRAVEAGPLEARPGERLKLRIFVDRSVVEVFANDGRQALARRIYPSRRDSVGVRLFSQGDGARVRSLQAWRIAPSNPF